MFANSEPVRGFEEGALQMCFADLRQLLDLFMTWDWSTYFHDYGQENSKYLRVNPQVAVVLLKNITSISHFAAGCDTRKSSQ
ncbi:exocyst complex component 6-like isoform X5 [Tachypleus tridentatus]|uniref:exocyst complex component 6-like isoform X5 n=1 Tax=Tachypleus tridentatus TaxID=6853 RepID=UPI003FCF4106